MEGLELLAISLSVLFGFGTIFSILLWCRSWRKEDREQTEQQIKALRGSIRKLTEAVEMLDHTAASLQTADGLLTQQLEDLRSSITKLQNIRTRPEETETEQPPEPIGSNPTSEEEPTEADPGDGQTEPTERSGAYDAVSDLLKQGKCTVDIARELDIGVAEVRMIARMRAADPPKEPA